MLRQWLDVEDEDRAIPPRLTLSPCMSSVGPVRRLPLTNVPLALPRSVMVKASRG